MRTRLPARAWMTGLLAASAAFVQAQATAPLRVLTCLDDKRPDFFSIAPGREPGFDHEVLLGFARLRRQKLEVVPVPTWDDLIPALLREEGDVIAGRFTDTPARRKRIAFTRPVFPTRFAVMSRGRPAPVGSVEELRKLKVGTVKGTPMEQLVRTLRVPREQVVDGIPVGGDFGEALRSGRIEAAVWGIESILAERLTDPAIQLGVSVGPTEHKAYGVRPTDTQLLADLDGYIDSFRRTPSWNRMTIKYFGAAAPEILRRATEDRARP